MRSIRNINPNRKVILSLIFLIFIIIVIVVLMVMILKINQKSVPEDSAQLQAEYAKVLTLGSGLKELPPGIKNNFEILNDKSKSDEERYQVLLNITDAFKSGYSINRTPEARVFIIKTLGPFAKENFPELYIPTDFDIPCLDSSCGASINDELQIIIDLIKNAELNSTPENKENDEYNREVILGNLTNMALLSESGEQFEVISLGNLVIDQLEQNNKVYDEPAQLLKDYLDVEYNFDYEKENEKFNNEKNK